MTPDPTTAPQMLQLPEWWVGGKVDVEDLVCNYFTWLLGDSVYVCTWLPPGYYALSPGEPVGGTQPTLRVWRQPGKFDSENRRDYAVIQIAAITPTRAESWKLIDFVRKMLDDEVCVGLPITLTNGSGAQITSSEEWMGPQLVPERLVDEKFIPISFKIGVRETVGLPNYQKIIRSLPR